MIRPVISIVLVLVFVLVGSDCLAAWEADPDDKRQVKAALAISVLRDKIPRTQSYFDDAYGFAILPSVTRVGLGFGGAYGKGIVIAGDDFIGTTRFWQFTSGIQGGARNFSMIVFFKDEEALQHYKTSGVTFMGQAGIAVANVGIAGTPSYNDGVAIVTVTRFGLMAEFTISGAKFSYKPVTKE